MSNRSFHLPWLCYPLIRTGFKFLHICWQLFVFFNDLPPHQFASCRPPPPHPLSMLRLSSLITSTEYLILRVISLCVCWLQEATLPHTCSECLTEQDSPLEYVCLKCCCVFCRKCKKGGPHCSIDCTNCWLLLCSQCRCIHNDASLVVNLSVSHLLAGRVVHCCCALPAGAHSCCCCASWCSQLLLLCQLVLTTRTDLKKCTT